MDDAGTFLTFLPHVSAFSLTVFLAMSAIVAGVGRCRFGAAASRSLKPRYFTTSLRRHEEQNAPKPPPPIDDSTSALDYKRSLRYRPPPLPAMDLPRSRSAEEAVTNILYNTPPPSLQPFKKCVLFYLRSMRLVQPVFVCADTRRTPPFPSLRPPPGMC